MAIDDLGIATVTFPEYHADAAALVDSLSHRGFLVRKVPGFVITARPPAARKAFERSKLTGG